MPTKEKRWDTIDAQIAFHQSGARGAFDFFVKIATAVVAGSAWLSVQPGLAAKAHQLATVGDGLLVFTAMLSAFIIWEHHQAWRRWRVAQSNLAGHGLNGRIIPLPAKRAAKVEASMAISCILFSAAFVWFNPLNEAPGVRAAKAPAQAAPASLLNKPASSR